VPAWSLKTAPIKAYLKKGLAVQLDEQMRKIVSLIVQGPKKEPGMIV